jgi:DNA-binding GntR family transcriptional regulator
MLCDRAQLAEQIKQSRETIERSLELLRRIDEMLAKRGVEPPR